MSSRHAPHRLARSQTPTLGSSRGTAACRAPGTHAEGLDGLASGTVLEGRLSPGQKCQQTPLRLSRAPALPGVQNQASTVAEVPSSQLTPPATPPHPRAANSCRGLCRPEVSRRSAGPERAASGSPEPRTPRQAARAGRWWRPPRFSAEVTAGSLGVRPSHRWANGNRGSTTTQATRGTGLEHPAQATWGMVPLGPTGQLLRPGDGAALPDTWKQTQGDAETCPEGKCRAKPQEKNEAERRRAVGRVQGPKPVHEGAQGIPGRSR